MIVAAAGTRKNKGIVGIIIDEQDIFRFYPDKDGRMYFHSFENKNDVRSEPVDGFAKFLADPANDAG
jgi:hypothetical protein